MSEVLRLQIVNRHYLLSDSYKSLTKVNIICSINGVIITQETDMIFLALVLTLPVISLQHNISPEEEDTVNKVSLAFRDSYKEAPHAVDMLASVFTQAENYECARNQEDCKAWKSWTVFVGLSTRGINCDETPENELCKKAIDLQGATKKMSHREIIEALSDIGGGVGEKDVKLINDVRAAVADYICYKEPEKCRVIRYVAVTFSDEFIEA